MKDLYVFTILALVVFMLAYGWRARSKNTELAKSLMRLTIAVALTVIASTVAIIIPSEPMAIFFQTLHYASTEWVLIFLMAFLERYTGRYEGTFATRMITYLISAFCSISLLLNVVYHHAVYCEYEVVGGVSYRMFRHYIFWYDVHKYFSYMLAMMGLLLLISANAQAIAFYKRRYYPAIIALLITLSAEGICAANDVHLDFALYGYIGLAIFLIYHVIYHVNNYLITTSLSYVTTDNSSGVVCFDIDGKCIYANEVIWNLYKEAKELSDFENIFAQYGYGRYKLDEKWEVELKRGGSSRYYDFTYGMMKSKKGEYVGCYFYLYDKTEAVISYKEARYKATHDALTGLSNSEAFPEKVHSICISYTKEPIYIIAADIKDFKLINDLFGREKGDEALVAFASAMKSCMPYYAACCRMNSDRFAFCVTKKDFSKEKIINKIKRLPVKFEGDAFQILIHFGIYEMQKGDEDVAVMYDLARMAIRNIKDDYQTHFAFYDGHLMSNVIREKEFVSEFEDALKDGQFKMYLQPQVRPDGMVLGAEALVRWEHPFLGRISPGDFIPVFENSGLIYKLDEFMWRQAAGQLREWKRIGKEDYHISVNISTKDFFYIDVLKTFIDIVNEYDIDPGKLKLEITESAFMKDPEKQLRLIMQLQMYGFNVEIDDFGSGFSSLNMLKDMKADVLKIDMGFLRKTEEEERSKVILNMILTLAKNLDMLVITEGVETKEQVDYLTEFGCDIFQGYYFDKPITVEEFERKYMQ